MNKIYIAIATCFCLAGCQSPASHHDNPALHAKIIKEGLLECYSPGTTDAKGTLVYCEASAVYVHHHTAILTNDKPFQTTSFLQFTLNEAKSDVTKDLPQYISNDILATAIKIEGMSGTPDKKWVLASSAFDRYDPKSARFDNYSMLLTWPVNNPAQAKIINASTREGVTSSVEIRKNIENYLGVPYFKIEGLTTLPNNRLVFGVRETGQSYKDFNYRFLLIEAPYSIDKDGNWRLGKEFKTLLDYTPTADLNLPAGLGLSSVEYNSTTNRLFILTTTENEGKLGAYLWSVNVANLNSEIPKMLTDQQGQPLHFTHKSEGMSFIDATTLLIVNDDDRILGSELNRQPHQAPYDIVKILD